MFDLIINFLTQLGGGPGSAENNLVRFGLPALFWAVLFIVAWARQRGKPLPRERLLLFGFGLFFARELFMFLHTAEKMLIGPVHETKSPYIEPFEHALAVSAIVVISAAFIRYILDDAALPRRYLILGLTAVGAGLFISFLFWPPQLDASPPIHFHDTPGAWFMHLTKVTFIILAMVLIVKRKGWVRNVVIVALSFLLGSVLLTLVNSLTGRAYDFVLCPISNNLHIWAVPIFGFVYFREQSIAKKQAESELAVYQAHLEKLVDTRTAELSTTNEKLKQEVSERVRVERDIKHRNAELSAQNLIAATISRSLNLNQVLREALDQTIALLEMERGCILLLDADRYLVSQLCCDAVEDCAGRPAQESDSPCRKAAWQAIETLGPAMVSTHHGAGMAENNLSYDADDQLLVSVPLVAHGKALGAMTLLNVHKKNFDEQELAILTAIGHQIGVAVENARLYQEAEEWAEGMSRLHEMSLLLNMTLDPHEICQLIAVQAAELLDCSATGLFRVDVEKGDVLGVASYKMVKGGVDGLHFTIAENKLLQELIAAGEPLVIEDVQADTRLPPELWQRYPMCALLGIPVRGTGDIQGILFLVESRRPRRWQDKEIRLLLNYTNRAGVAWENAYLHKQLEWAAALQERQRIAAEMHDGLAQTISTLALRNDQASQMVEEGRLHPALDELAAIQDIISVAGGDLRRSIASLRQDPQPRCSLQDALSGLTQNGKNGHTSEISFHSTILAPLHLPPSQFDQIVSLVQEALLNAQKHAAANQISIQLAKVRKGYQVIIQDDGQGFDVAGVADQSGNHFGVSIMRARAEHLGGELVIKSAPGSGTQVLLRWPNATDSAGVSKTDQEAVKSEPVLHDFIEKRKRQIWQK